MEEQKKDIDASAGDSNEKGLNALVWGMCAALKRLGNSYKNLTPPKAND
jgi:hypothetical protein